MFVGSGPGALVFFLLFVLTSLGRRLPCDLGRIREWETRASPRAEATGAPAGREERQCRVQGGRTAEHAVSRIEGETPGADGNRTHLSPRKATTQRGTTNHRPSRSWPPVDPLSTRQGAPPGAATQPCVGVLYQYESTGVNTRFEVKSAFRA